MQLILFTLILVAGAAEGLLRRPPRRPRSVAARIRQPAGAAAIAVAIAVAGRAKVDLAGSFTMSPSPNEDAALVDTGIYGVVRHPMYLSVLLALAGYVAVIGSRLAGLGTVAAACFLALKIRHEERLLKAHYPSYDDYRERVRWRFIPWIH